MSVGRTFVLPIDPNADWNNFTWQAKTPNSKLDYIIEFAAWAAMERATYTGPLELRTTPDLQVLAIALGTYNGQIGQLVLELSGGNPGGVSLVQAGLLFNTGRKLEVTLHLPILATDWPKLVPAQTGGADSVLIGGVDVTLGGIDVGYGEAVNVVPQQTHATIGGEVITIGGETIE